MCPGETEMATAHPEKCRRRAVLLVDTGVAAAEVEKDLGVAESGLRRSVDHHLVEAGRKSGVSVDGRDKFVCLRRDNRVLRMVRDGLDLQPRPSSRRRTACLRSDVHLQRQGRWPHFRSRVPDRLGVSRVGIYPWRAR